MKQTQNYVKSEVAVRLISFYMLYAHDARRTESIQGLYFLIPATEMKDTMLVI